MSIKSASKDILGWASFISSIVVERFSNIDYVKEAKCPMFFMHGIKDKLIPYRHSEELSKVCSQYNKLHLVKEMDHNEFRFELDLIEPFR